MAESYGLWALVPTAVVLLLAVTTHRALESLLVGILVGVLIIDPSTILTQLADKSLAVMTDEDVAWIILVCSLMGSLIALLIRTGATRVFVDRVAVRVTTRAKALLMSWGLGVALFVDDYLNSLAVGTSMGRITDKFKTPREMLAYVVDSTAAPISVIIPISTWAVFFGVLLEDADVVPKGEGIWLYVEAIPYMFYAWIAALMVPLVVSGYVPLIGPMRRAQIRADESGACIPPGAEHIAKTYQAIQEKEGAESSLWLFIGPMAALVGFTWYFDLDFLKGIYVTLAITVMLILVRRTLTLEDTFNTIIDGVKTMIEPLAVLVCAFLLKEVNDGLQLTELVIHWVTPLVTAETLPLMVFLVMGVVAFATGDNWGVFVISIPIVTALAGNLGADMVLVVGATLSGSTFGSHACFYSDATVLTAQATGCTPFQHAYTQLPYALIAAALTALLYWLI